MKEKARQEEALRVFDILFRAGLVTLVAVALLSAAFPISESTSFMCQLPCTSTKELRSKRMFGLVQSRENDRISADEVEHSVYTYVLGDALHAHQFIFLASIESYRETGASIVTTEKVSVFNILNYSSSTSCATDRILTPEDRIELTPENCLEQYNKSTDITVLNQKFVHLIAIVSKTSLNGERVVETSWQHRRGNHVVTNVSTWEIDGRKYREKRYSCPGEETGCRVVEQYLNGQLVAVVQYFADETQRLVYSHQNEE